MRIINRDISQCSFCSYEAKDNILRTKTYAIYLHEVGCQANPTKKNCISCMYKDKEKSNYEESSCQSVVSDKLSLFRGTKGNNCPGWINIK